MDGLTGIAHAQVEPSVSIRRRRNGPPPIVSCLVLDPRMNCRGLSLVLHLAVTESRKLIAHSSVDFE
jgi:hypothetical protein